MVRINFTNYNFNPVNSKSYTFHLCGPVDRTNWARIYFRGHWKAISTGLAQNLVYEILDPAWYAKFSGSIIVLMRK